MLFAMPLVGYGCTLRVWRALETLGALEVPWKVPAQGACWAWTNCLKLINFNDRVMLFFFFSFQNTQESCVLKAFMVKCASKLLIDTLERHFNQYLMNILIDTQLILGEHSWLSVDQFMLCIDWKLVDCWPRCWWSVNQGVDEVSTEYQL